MGSNTYTEDDFKQLLKNLFLEKKRVKELQKQLEERGVQKKFQAKLADIHKLSLTEDYAQLKTAYLEKEKDNAHLQNQLEKVRPALKKLVDNLKSARSELEMLKADNPVKNTYSEEALEEANQKVSRLEEQVASFEEDKQKLVKQEDDKRSLQRQVAQLQEELDNLHKKNAAFQEEQHSFDLQIETLNKILEDERAEVSKVKTHEQQETQRFESERSRLVERLAESISQIQKQTEIIKDLREESATTQKKIYEYEQQERQKEKEILHLKAEISKISLESSQASKLVEYQAIAMRDEKADLLATVTKLEQEVVSSKEIIISKDILIKNLQIEVECTKDQLQRSDFATLSGEYEAKLADLSAQKNQMLQEAAAAQEHFAQVLLQKEAAQEEVLERSYAKMKEMSEKYGSLIQERELLQKKIEEHKALLSKFEKEQSTLHMSLKNTKLHCEERDAEIRKAQQHMAKKVKETTILRDLVERQKGQLIELQGQCEKQKSELERLQNSLNLQRMHEEKLQTMAKERAYSAENLTKEWQEKFLALQQDWQEKKAQLIELQKMRKTYDHMATTFSSLKNILGNSIESPTTEESQNPGN